MSRDDLFDADDKLACGCALVRISGARFGFSPCRMHAYAPELRDALDALLTRYVDLVNCGDCGYWNPETEKEVIAARSALASATERSEASS